MIFRIALRGVACLAICIILLAVTFADGFDIAQASPSGGTAWKISMVAEPTNLALTAGGPFEPLDQYVLVLTNVGKRESTGPVRLTDVLPPGVTVGNAAGGPGWNCPVGVDTSMVSCIYDEQIATLAQSGVLTIPVRVATTDSLESLTNTVTIAGGGASVAKAEVLTSAGAGPPVFGFLGFTLQTSDAFGESDTQAGDHPYALTTTLDFPQGEIPARQSGQPGKSVQVPKDIEIDLPPGLVGNPEATPRCTIVEVFAKSCRANTRVGTFFVNFAQGLFEVENSAFPIYNVIPEHGYPAEFGFFAEGVERPVFLYATVGPAPEFRVHISAPDILLSAEVRDVIVTFFGNPESQDGETTSPTAFLTNPSSCATSLEAEANVYTWEEPSIAIEPRGVAQAKQIFGCSRLQFHPSLSVLPEDTNADEPSGYVFDVRFPQSQAINPDDLTDSPVKDTTIELPAGVSVSPSAADGLRACPLSGPEGIDLLSSTPGNCPLASQIGTAEASTPLLAEPLHGQVYVAQPGCGGTGQAACTEADAARGNLLGLYVQLEGSGVTVKLHGTASANPANGQLTATFKETPQLPVSDLKLSFKGGPRAPLANPQTCGEANTRADMTPWSSPETPNAKLLSSFTVTGCEGFPFAPTFSGGTTNAAAGAYTSFSATFGRTDRMQDLSAIQVRTPPGLAGMLSRVPLCPEQEAALGTCSAASKIGTATAGAGSGSHPFWVSGPVYLTGAYKGAPFGLTVAIPAVAGPFNLGTVVVRSTLNVDPSTAAVTVTSDPLPQILDGIPLRVQTVNVTLDRPQFIFNPTNCSAQQVTATIASPQGATAQVSSPFAAGGCKNLPFNPGFAVSTRVPSAKKRGTTLDVKVSSTPGQANIHSVAVSLPKQLPARLTTIQKACRDSTFNANPAACPAASLVGIVKGVSPVLPVTLAGPAYLVSHGGAAFPDLDIILQGEGVRVDLTGSINISRSGITSSAFASIPDVPITSFELRLPEGPFSALTTAGDLCAKPLTMPTTIVGQNGRRLQRTTKIAVAGCPKTVKAKKVKKKAHKATRSRGGAG